MEWMATTAERRRHPVSMWPMTRSIVMLGMNYAPTSDPLAILAQPGRGAISCYAQCKDYHDVVRTGLKRVAGSLARASGADVKIFVDTAPLMEKPLSQAAGLGWQGKHTNLVSENSLVAVPRRHPDRGGAGARCARGRSLRTCHRCSTSARPRHSPRPTSSMRAAASPT